jgi:hypothetical protein
VSVFYSSGFTGVENVATSLQNNYKSVATTLLATSIVNFVYFQFVVCIRRKGKTVYQVRYRSVCKAAAKLKSCISRQL